MSTTRDADPECGSSLLRPSRRWEDVLQDRNGASRPIGAAVPVAFSGCFGWLHLPESDESDVAILLCPPLARDALDAHHSIRRLADKLASAGYSVMRFDYPGTGDSCDLGDAECWSVWQGCVQEAADWLRAATGARQLILGGLRIGAALAALAAEHRNDVAGLVLLAPVLQGRSYIRQLSVAMQLQVNPVSVPDRSVEFLELRFGPETVDLIDKMDLRDVDLTAGQRVLMVAQPDAKLAGQCIAAWDQRGVDTTFVPLSALKQLLRHNLQGESEPVDFSAVLGWVAQAFPLTRESKRDAVARGELVIERPVLHLGGCVETPLQFGPENRLFGILCQPDRTVADLVVIIGNTGRDPHYGSARFGVEFARRLAAEGIASLRMDFAGLGDSAGTAGNEDVLSPIFDEDRSPDITAAIDVLERLGYARFAAQGLCAGAYHALHGALADDRLEALLLVNMPVLIWRKGDSIDFVARKTSKPTRYLELLVRRDSWKAMLAGKFDLRGIARAQLERVGERLLQLAVRLRPLDQRGFAHQAMAALAKRRIKTLLLFSPGDGGIDALERDFGRNAKGLRAFSGVSMQVVPELDHMLSGRLMRRTAADLMIGFLAADRNVRRETPLPVR